MTWSSGMQAIQTESGGLLELHVVRVADVAGLRERAGAGDPLAVQMLQAAGNTLLRIASAPKRRPMMCCACPRRLRKKTPFAIVVAAPFTPDPARCLALAVCQKCAMTPDAIRAKAVQSLRHVWPDARSVTIPASTAAGHA